MSGLDMTGIVPPYSRDVSAVQFLPNSSALGNSGDNKDCLFSRSLIEIGRNVSPAKLAAESLRKSRLETSDLVKYMRSRITVIGMPVNQDIKKSLKSHRLSPVAIIYELIIILLHITND
jgi:hypothetical protein